jgi:quercetin dioxygenase-like cupin family protein
MMRAVAPQNGTLARAFPEESMARITTILLTTLALAWGSTALAQQAAPAAPTSNIKRTMLQKVDVPGTNYDTLTGIAEIAPSTNIGRHTHPGPETGYVMEGTMTLLVDGQEPKTLSAGDSYQVPPGAIHDARSGDKGVKVLAVYVVERGKPLASPAN